MSKPVNWIHYHTENTEQNQDGLPKINLKSDNFLLKINEKSKNCQQKCNNTNKAHKQFVQNNCLEETLYNMSKSFYNAGHDCIKQRFFNCVSLQTLVVPCCVNLFYASKLMLHYTLSKFKIFNSHKENLSELFLKLPDEIKEYLQSQSLVETNVFLEILEQTDYVTYLIDPKKAFLHINFFLRLASNLQAIVSSINQNMYFL